MLCIAPSILSSDFANLQREVEAIAEGGADWVHVDVMDGHFVPNLTIGAPVVKSLKPVSRLPLDVHLMISDPLTYVPDFVKAGADLITFHVESDSPPEAVIEAIRAGGKKVGVSLRPKTPAEAIFPLLKLVDLVLVMTVEPGFGGQSFMHEMLPKIEALAQKRTELGCSFILEVDGGITPETAPLVARAGAELLVAGSAVFGKPDYGEAIAALRHACQPYCTK